MIKFHIYSSRGYEGQYRTQAAALAHAERLSVHTKGLEYTVVSTDVYGRVGQKPVRVTVRPNHKIAH